MAKSFSPIVLFCDSAPPPSRRLEQDEQPPASKDPMDMDIDPSEARAHSMAIKGSRASDSASMVSPPSSYSSYSSSSSVSLDALATTMSPARIDVHRKSIQRMIQRNSLLWWELVRYTRNLERKEREQEQEKEAEQLQHDEIQDVSSKPKVVLHYHHHHHHHHPSLPPLDPKQHSLTSSRSMPSLKAKHSSRPHPYEYLANINGELKSQAHRSREDGDRRVSSFPLDSHDHADQALERDRTGHARRYSGSGFGYRSVSRTPSPSLSPSLSPTRPSFEGAARVPQSYSHHPSRHQQRQPSERSRPSQHHRVQGSAEEFSRHPYSQPPQPPQQPQQPPYDPRAGSGYDQEAQASVSAASTPLAKKLPPMDVGSPYPLVPPSPLASAGLYSSGPSSTASSPRSREQSSSTTTHGYTQHQHQHQYQPQSQSQSQSQPLRDAHYQSSHPYQRPYPSLQHETGPTAYRPRGADHTHLAQHAQDPHRQHHQPSHHHHQQHQHQHQRRQRSPSRPTPVQHHSSTESLPRPIPVKPASLHSNPATTTPLTSSSAHPQDRSLALPSSHPHLADSAHNGSSSNHGSATTTMTTTTTTATTNNNNNNTANNGNVDPNRKRRGNLPKSVTSVLKSWLVQNAIHPYPTEEEKMRLSEETHLSMNQISNWFINARRRILQPILVEAAAAAVAGTDAPVENVLIVRKGKGSRMQVEMEGVSASSSSSSSAPLSLPATSSSASAAAGSSSANATATAAAATNTTTTTAAAATNATADVHVATTATTTLSMTESDSVTKQDAPLESSPSLPSSAP
ncbi:hypothetical protein EC968_010043 [Mortierella alpina]|nr:hypothetical protein EC968_010043 [Mortierella alpina]